ncbi:flagellar biosynthesis protein FlhF [Virgibacillus proomii]|uniref:flagellar biosynthesis protein FlhF n=1 Tax=Virgibacillus proomii TaxID=84407 RepID=UPI001C0F7BAB|nr:flagellar biosynthesis protein FlhF [Virgibacillus proomii]MBU5267781.1 flagellar biosynthesis protein FlhF [Virgibacillus proomii]
MKVKKYIADSMPEAMKQIRKELGTEAVILQTRNIKKGRFFGLLKKQQIEVVAVRDPQPVAPKKQVVTEDKGLHKNQMVKPTENSNLLNELKQVKQLLHQSAIETITYPADYQLVYHYLLDQEVEQQLAASIIEAVIENQQNKQQINRQLIVKQVEEEIKKRLEMVSFQGLTYKNKLVYFVGPTGVGKTTTIAKVAAKSKLEDRKRVALITADTYRIAAVEQLKTYADILQVPIEVVYTRTDFEEAIKKFSAYDVVFIDTAGRNFREEMYVKQLQADIGIGRAEGADTYLVLSLTAKPKDIADIFDRFKPLNITEVIFTKMDETSQFGSMLNITLRKNIGVAYISNGQDVPEHLLNPSSHLLATYVMRDAYEK